MSVRLSVVALRQAGDLSRVFPACLSCENRFLFWRINGEGVVVMCPDPRPETT